VVVYRTASDPFRAVVLYDGGYTFNQQNPDLSQTIRGFYQSSETAHTAKLTYIVGNGQQSFTEMLNVNGTTYTNPFVGALGSAWDNPTYNLTLPSGASSVSTQLSGANSSSVDCVSWELSCSALLFRTRMPTDCSTSGRARAG